MKQNEQIKQRAQAQVRVARFEPKKFKLAHVAGFAGAIGIYAVIVLSAL